MFLARLGAGELFRFDEIYSALQKSLRRNDLNLSLEMAKEFTEYPNALKKRLIQNCCEDCPNLYLINDIFKCQPELTELVKFIPTICQHIKCREATYGFRVACEEPMLSEPISKTDTDLLIVLRKCFASMCKNNGDCSELIDYFQTLMPDKSIQLKKIYNFISKDRIVVYMLAAWKCIPYITNANYKKYPIPIDFNWTTFRTEPLPNYVYDKHVSKSPIEQKTYKFFIENIILEPRMPKTELEIRGEQLYITSNKASGEFIRPIVSCKTINDNIKVIQTQLITSKYKQHVYFADVNRDGLYSHVLKGPYKTKHDIDNLILSDKLKQLANLNSLNVEIVEYQHQIFALMNNFIQIHYDLVLERSSKLETNVLIYDGPLYELDLKNLPKLSSERIVELLKILAFRKIIGTNDTCNRNILDYNNQFVSIDDPVLLDETNFMFKKAINITQANLFRKVLRKHFDNIYNWLEQFGTNIESFEMDLVYKTFMLDKVAEFMEFDNWKFNDE